MDKSSVVGIPQTAAAKSVQELARERGEVPDCYLSPGADINRRNQLTEEIPVIDISRLLSSSDAAVDEELAKFRSALTSWGCFQVINHGIEGQFLQELHHVSKQFFHLPPVEKQRYAREANGIEGYGSDMILFENQKLDWTDRVYLKVNPVEQQKSQFWPENPPSLRGLLQEYTSRITQLLGHLLKSIAKSLSLPEDCFVNQLGEQPEIYARLNYYPPCPCPEQVYGLKPHADGSAITILLPDSEVQGLEVMKDDQWVGVTALPEALLVNLGDQVEIMSNGVLRSPVHRAVTNSSSERVTIAMFCSPGAEQEIGPVEQLIDEGRPQIYKRMKNYPERYFEYYQQGKRPIESAKM